MLNRAGRRDPTISQAEVKKDIRKCKFCEMAAYSLYLLLRGEELDAFNEQTALFNKSGIINVKVTLRVIITLVTSKPICFHISQVRHFVEGGGGGGGVLVGGSEGIFP